MGVEDGGKEQQEQDGEDDVGKGVVEAVVEQEQDGAQYDRGADPHNLHAGTGREREQFCVAAIVVAGTADAEPSQ